MAKATQEHRTLPNSLQMDFRKGIPGIEIAYRHHLFPYGSLRDVRIVDHTDYTSPKYQELLKQKGLGQSMSRLAVVP